jgi:hypothetical protein
MNDKDSIYMFKTLWFKPMGGHNQIALNSLCKNVIIELLL